MNQAVVCEEDLGVDTNVISTTSDGQPQHRNELSTDSDLQLGEESMRELVLRLHGSLDRQAIAGWDAVEEEEEEEIEEEEGYLRHEQLSRF